MIINIEFDYLAKAVILGKKETQRAHAFDHNEADSE